MTIHWYGVFMALGFLCGFAHCSLLGKSRGWRYEDISDMLLWVIAAGLIGARLAYVASDIGYFREHPLQIVRLDKGGLIYYGGFLGGALALWAYGARHGDRIWNLLDFIVTPLPLAHAFGRAGCFLNGCCYGKVWNGPWAVRYPAGSLACYEQAERTLLPASAETSLAVHPVQLYELAFNLLLYGLLLRVFTKRRKEGQATAVYLCCYGAGRFALEFLRGHTRVFMAGFSIAQWTSMGLLLGGSILFFWLRRHGRPVAAPRAA